MKLFHTEKGKEVVYVQMQDIIFLLHQTDMPMPASIFTKVFTDVIIVTDENRFDFVKFDEEPEVKFFRDLEFIIDFDQYKNLTIEQLGEESKRLAKRANNISDQWNSMSKEEREKNSALLDEHKGISYMMDFLLEIYYLNHGKRTMPFPKFVTKPKKNKRIPFFRKKM